MKKPKEAIISAKIKKNPKPFLIVMASIFIGMSLLVIFNSGNNSSKFNIAKILQIDDDSKVINVLESVGIKKIRAIQREETLDIDGEQAYKIITDFTERIIMFVKNGEITTIGWNGIIFYENNQVLSLFADYVMTYDEQYAAFSKSKKAINEFLKSPSSAKYPDMEEWKFGKAAGILTTQGYVDSQNAFGAMIRAEFQVKFKDETIISLIIDGTEFILQEE